MFFCLFSFFSLSKKGRLDSMQTQNKTAKVIKHRPVLYFRSLFSLNAISVNKETASSHAIANHRMKCHCRILWNPCLIDQHPHPVVSLLLINLKISLSSIQQNSNYVRYLLSHPRCQFKSSICLVLVCLRSEEMPKGLCLRV